MRGMALSAALAALLVASLAGKGVTSSRGQMPEAAEANPAIALLGERGLAVSLPPPNTAPAWITGNLGACLVRIADIAPQGWSRAIVQEQATGGSLSFAFAGRFYDDQPVMRTRLEDYRRRLLRYFGIRAGNTVVRAVTVSAGCPDGIIRAEDAIDLSR